MTGSDVEKGTFNVGKIRKCFIFFPFRSWFVCFRCDSKLSASGCSYDRRNEKLQRHYPIPLQLGRLFLLQSESTINRITVNNTQHFTSTTASCQLRWLHQCTSFHSRWIKCVSAFRFDCDSGTRSQTLHLKTSEVQLCTGASLRLYALQMFICLKGAIPLIATKETKIKQRE